MTKIIQRHDTSTNWTSVNPILSLGEMGIETDTNKFKFGDGVTNWSGLAYSSTEIDLSDYYDKETTDALLDTKQDVLTAGTNITIENNVISATGGGGGTDLSDYYTKEETYNQEEVDNLLDEKQDVLTPTVPINIGTTTIGGPKNIDTTQGYINPIYYNDNAIEPVSVSSTGCQLRSYSIENPSTWSQMFDRDNVSYFDIPVNFASEIQKVQRGEKSETGLLVKLSAPTYVNSNGAWLLIAGSLSDEGFDPIAASMVKPGGTNDSNRLGVAFLNGQIKNSGYRVLTLSSNAEGSSTRNTGTSSNLMTGVFLGIRYSNTIAAVKAQYNSSSTAWMSAYYSKTTTEEVTSRLSSINVLRVIVYPSAAVGTGYLPTVEGTKLYITGSVPIAGDDSTATDWNINSGAVTTYGISLKYDGQTIQVNSDGELVANLDELGNEVNTLAGRVTTVESKANANTEALGGKKIVSLTKAEYEALTSPDYFAWTQTSGQNTIYTTTTDNGQISKLYDSSLQEIPLNIDYPEASYIDGNNLYYADDNEMTYEAVRDASSDIEASSNVDNNTIYILSDSEEIYLGSIKIANYGANDDLSNLSNIGKNVIDGQWVYAGFVTLSNATATSMYTIDLSSYLPDDGQVYEVMLNQQGAYSSNDTFTGVQVKSDIIEDFVAFGYPQAQSRRVGGQVILPVGQSRSIVYQIWNHALNSNSGLKLVAYRRIGTNQ